MTRQFCELCDTPTVPAQWDQLWAIDLHRAVHGFRRVMSEEVKRMLLRALDPFLPAAETEQRDR